MIPDLQPTLSGSLVKLRPIKTSDWQALFEAASNPSVWAHHNEKDRYKEDVFRRFFDDAISSGSALSIIDTKTGKVIGSSRFHNLQPDSGEIEIGWTFLARDFWGGLYNSEVKRLMIAHALGFAQTVVFWVAAENTRSRKAMSKIGGNLRHGAFTKYHNGVSHDYVIFEITEKSFASGPLMTSSGTIGSARNP